MASTLVIVAAAAAAIDVAARAQFCVMGVNQGWERANGDKIKLLMV